MFQRKKNADFRTERAQHNRSVRSKFENTREDCVDEEVGLDGVQINLVPVCCFPKHGVFYEVLCQKIYRRMTVRDMLSSMSNGMEGGSFSRTSARVVKG